MGIIDILQSYRLKKKLEHGFKSIVYDGVSNTCFRYSLDISLVGLIAMEDF